MAEDERCQGCERWMVPLNIEPYRGHNLCYLCIKGWKRLDGILQEVYGRGATWQEFLHPRSAWLRGKIAKLEKTIMDEVAPAISGGRTYIKH